MVFAGLNQLVAPFSVAQVDGLHQPEADQRLERPVYRRQSGRLVIDTAHLTVNVLSAGQFIHMLEHFQNFLATFGEPHILCIALTW